MSGQTGLHSEEYQMIHGFGQVLGQTINDCPKHGKAIFVLLGDKTKDGNGTKKICEKCLLQSKINSYRDD
ncbi:MAG: hypothetical protein WC657_04115 [Candidatus Paceibacterota bacterium]|jgi:hypothetical protein